MTALTFTNLVALARQLFGKTEAEFDYSLAVGKRDTDSAMAALTNAAYALTNAHLPEVNEATRVADLLQRQDNARALIDATMPEREAMIAAARLKHYAGWSVHSAGPVRYAESDPS